MEQYTCTASEHTPHVPFRPQTGTETTLRKTYKQLVYVIRFRKVGKPARYHAIGTGNDEQQLKTVGRTTCCHDSRVT